MSSENQAIIPVSEPSEYTRMEVQREEYLIRKACVQVLQNHRTSGTEKLRAAKLLRDMIIRAELASRPVRKIRDEKRGKKDTNHKLEEILSRTNAA